VPRIIFAMLKEKLAKVFFMVPLILNPFVYLSFNLKIIFGCYYVSLN